MPFIVDGPVFARPIKRVYVKKKWKDPWILVGANQDGVKPISSVVASSPEVSSAELLFQSGNIFRAGVDTQFTYRAPVDFGDQYIQLTSTHPGENEVVHWRGIVRHDELASERKDIASGDQPMISYGLEDVLDKAAACTIKGIHDGAEYDLGVWPTFNRRNEYGSGLDGNRTDSALADGFHGFGETSKWNLKQIIERVLEDNKPGGIDWVLAGQTDALELREEEVHIEPGESLLSVLNRLVNRQRGLLWRLPDWPYYDPAKSEVEIEIRTIVGSAVTIGSKTLPANSVQSAFNLSSTFPLSHMPEPVPIRRSTAERYERLIVQGEPVRMTATFSYGDNTLAETWSALEESNYAAGGGGTNASEKDSIRSRDVYRKVYQCHMVPKDWDFKVGDGLGGITNIPLLLAPQDDGTFKKSKDLSQSEQDEIPRNMSGVSFHPDLPFIDNTDYSASPPEADSSLTENQRIPMLVVIGHQAKYYHAESKFGCDCSPADNELACWVEPGINHEVALGFFTDTDTEISPVTDYQGILLTASFNLSVRQNVVSKLTEDNEGTETRTPHENDRPLVITVPGAEYWYVADNTITGINDSLQLEVIHPDNQEMRNDIDKLEAVAAVAKPWFSQQRQPIRIPVKDIARLFEVGAFMTSLNLVASVDPINTPCTRRIIDWINFTTIIETGDIALDEIIAIGQGLL